MSLTQGGGQIPAPSVVPAFQGDVSQMTNFANSLGGLSTPTGAFSASPGMTNAANVGNNYFGAGNTGGLGISALNNIFSGANLSPNSNPYLQQTIQGMQQAFGQTLGQGTDQLNAQFQQAGQTGANSGARNNTLAQFARGSMSDFTNALGNQMFGQYNQGQNQMTSALSMMDQPLQGASMASALGQAPGQEAVAGQQYGINLSEIPFQLLQQVMQSAPISQPSYQPAEPNDTAGWLNFLGSLAGAGAQGAGAYFGAAA